MKAVILAAGMGKRIRDQHRLPKGFIKLGERTIIEESIEKLLGCGIEKILLITGYADHYYEQLARTNPALSTIKNTQFDQSGSLYSLYCARDWLDDDFILLESDLVYDEQAILELRHDSHSNVILISGFTNSSDEVFVETHENKLVNMSKNRKNLNQSRITGEFVGINKFSLNAYRQLLDIFALETELLMRGDYETDGLVSLAKKIQLYCHKINDLIWCEIDDLTHLQRAEKIYNKIKMSLRA